MQLVLRLGADENGCDGATDLIYPKIYPTHFSMDLIRRACLSVWVKLQGEDMKRNSEMGETAIQPVPAQTADLSISGLHFMSHPVHE